MVQNCKNSMTAVQNFILLEVHLFHGRYMGVFLPHCTIRPYIACLSLLHTVKLLPVNKLTWCMKVWKLKGSMWPKQKRRQDLTGYLCWKNPFLLWTYVSIYGCWSLPWVIMLSCQMRLWSRIFTWWSSWSNVVESIRVTYICG